MEAELIAEVEPERRVEADAVSEASAVNEARIETEAKLESVGEALGYEAVGEGDEVAHGYPEAEAKVRVACPDAEAVTRAVR